jgi:hypothetical protein
MPVVRPYLDPTTKGYAVDQREIDRLQTAISRIRDGHISGWRYYAAAPNGGASKQGDFVRFDEPVVETGTNGEESILFGWICVESGDPGVWEEMRFVTSATYGTGGGGDSIYDIVGMYNGIPPDSIQVLRFPAVRAYTLPLNLSGSKAHCQVAPTALTTFSIAVDGTSVGTMSFSASATVGTFSVNPAVDVAIGELLEIEAPAIGDATFEGLSFCIKATL